MEPPQGVNARRKGRDRSGGPALRCPICHVHPLPRQHAVAPCGGSVSRRVLSHGLAPVATTTRPLQGLSCRSRRRTNIDNVVGKHTGDAKRRMPLLDGCLGRDGSLVRLARAARPDRAAGVAAEVGDEVAVGEKANCLVTAGAIRYSRFKGHTLGSDWFMSNIETVAGGRLRADPMDRPRWKLQGNNKRWSEQCCSDLSCPDLSAG